MRIISSGAANKLGVSKVNRTDGDGPITFVEVLDTIKNAGSADKVQLGEILDRFGRRAFGPFLLVPALIAILPVIGMLPGVSLAMAGIEIAVSLDLVLGKRGLKLPKRVRSLSVPRKTLSRSVELARPFAKWTSKIVRTRLTAIVQGEARFLVGALALLLAVLMLIGALVPGGIVAPAIAMMILGLGLTSHDGVLVLLALLIALGSMGAIGWWFLLR